MIYFKTFLLFLVFLIGCSPTSLQELRVEADAEARKLAKELHSVETIQDVKKKSKRIKKRFHRIAKLLVESRKYGASVEGVLPSGERLFIELSRVYEIPGAQEVLERIQTESVQLLDKDHSR